MRPFGFGLLTVCAAVFVAVNACAEIPMDLKFVKTEQQGAVVIARLDNPPKNLMNAGMVTDLDKLVDAVAADDSVKVLLITGNMEGVFIQHYDVAELVAVSNMLQQGQTLTNPGELHATNKVFLKIERMPKPVIAAINGFATGGGFELTLACDIRYLADTGLVGLPEAGIGILPGAGGTQRLSRLLGQDKALELMMVGEVVPAPKALELGMVHKVFPADKLMENALAFANRLANMPGNAAGTIKRVVTEGAGKPMEDALLIEQGGFWDLMESGEALERMKAYVEGGQNAGNL